jgi:hypothetical protein
MTRKFFSLTTLSAALLGLLILVSTPYLNAQCCSLPSAPVPATPNAPTVTGITGTPYPPNAPPTTLTFTVSLSDSTPGASIFYSYTSSSGGISGSGTIAAPSSTQTASGSFSLTVTIAQADDITFTLKAYAQIPANPSACPPVPASADSATTTANF